ncbi:MAG: Hsp20/alpha crystallin family protein [Melioribacteraceae bacterium]|nr:Hsp20/alpha crystallin family protein [Melioribacteraceae bacterium]
MALIKWNPSRELLRVERDLNRLFKPFWDKFGMGKTTDENYELASWAPLADIVENNNEYLVKLDIPGVDKKDVKVSYSNGVLSVSGERKEEKESKDANYYRCERSYGKYYRSFTLPEGIKEDKIDAEFKNGTLTIVIPKAEESKPKQIDIKVN